MQKLDTTLKKILKAFGIIFGAYVVAYVLNSAAGGYWPVPARDGHVRYKPEFGGLSMRAAIMWQPRFGRNAVGHFDYVGLLFQPLILLDRAWLHPTHYIVDDGFDAWFTQLPPSKIHPKFRQEFINARAKPAA